MEPEAEEELKVIKQTVLVDSREQRPLVFPSFMAVNRMAAVWGPEEPELWSFETKVQALSFGDYCIEGFQDVVCVERKADVDRELFKNLVSDDKHRFLNALTRLVDGCEHPVLFIESMPMAVWRAKDQKSQDLVLKALDLLLELKAKFGFDLVWGGRSDHSPQSRRRVGEIMLRLMVQHVRRKL